MTRRNRSVLLSVLVLVLCLALIAGGSYALFTDEITLDQHLQAGTLKATLIRTELVTKELDDKGFLVSNENDPDKRRINFTEATTENAFGIESTDKIVPGSKYVAKFELSNTGDTAFGYWIEIGCTDKEDGENLAKQVKITVNNDKNSAFDGIVSKGVVATQLTGPLLVKNPAVLAYYYEKLTGEALDLSEDNPIRLAYNNALAQLTKRITE